jgi:hypothetical protein
MIVSTDAAIKRGDFSPVVYDPPSGSDGREQTISPILFYEALSPSRHINNVVTAWVVG